MSQLPPLAIEASVQTSRFDEADHTIVDLHKITIAVGGGEEEDAAPSRELLSDAELRLTAGTRYALLGRNGSGKSIFLRCLASGCLFDPDAQLRLRIQLVSQNFETPPSPDWTVLNEVNVAPFGYDLSEALDATKRAQRRAELRSGTRGKEARTEALKLEAAAAASADSRDDHLDAAAAEVETPPSASEISEAFAVLGIPTRFLSQPFASLSGGWRMRITLAKTLLYHPLFLLLDEPTNHLDIEGINRLVALLSSEHLADVTVIFVSHDLHFVNAVAQSVIHLTNGGELKVTKGNYATFVKERGDRKKFTDRYADEQKKDLDRLLSSIDESLKKAGRDDKLRKQLVSRRDKAIERSGMMRNSHGHRYKRNGVENAGYFNTLLRDVEVVAEERPVHFHFASAISRTSSGPLVTVDNLKYGYPRGGFKIALADLSIVRGERVILLGPNGHGKTTLVRCLNRELTGATGTVTVTPSIGYFDQHAVPILGKETRPTLEYALAVAAAASASRSGDISSSSSSSSGSAADVVRKALGAFGLGPHGATPVALLSGGQRVALEFALISLRNPALLVLDEPSAHLDLEAREGLARALAEFDGGVLFISHDVGFIDLCKPTRALLCRDGKFSPVRDWRATALAL